jgi:hypothetical protein
MLRTGNSTINSITLFENKVKILVLYDITGFKVYSIYLASYVQQGQFQKKLQVQHVSAHFYHIFFQGHKSCIILYAWEITCKPTSM